MKGKPSWNRGRHDLPPAWNKGQRANRESIAKMVATRKANGSYNHSEETKNKIRISVIKGIANRNIRRYDTDIEKMYKAFLDMADLDYKFQYNFNNKFLVDIAMPQAKLVIEIDGKYWHNNDKQRKRDNARDIYIRSCGWTVWRVDEAFARRLGKLVKMCNEKVDN